jgi:CheY-like chemotaxis protein
VVRDTSELIRASIRKGADLRFVFAPDTAPIEADVSQLRQVVMNLITNASDALAGNDGVISLTTGSLDIAESAPGAMGEELTPGRYTFIEVRDTGRGMDQATQARMFEPFFSSKATGRGLGLSGVLGIVRGHGGSIRVSSDPGSGTTITVLLPASDQTPSADPPTGAAAAGWSGKGTILIVDDEETVRRVARRALRKAGFEVLTAEDGAQGVEVFQRHREAIVGVLLDMTMPVMGGAEAFRKLRELDPTVRVVLSTGYDKEEAIRQFRGEGPFGFLQKPYRPRDLREAFRDEPHD